MLALTYLSEFLGELSLTAMLGQIWSLPFLIYMNIGDTTQTNKWVIFAVFTLLLAYPNGTSHIYTLPIPSICAL